MREEPQLGPGFHKMRSVRVICSDTALFSAGLCALAWPV